MKKRGVWFGILLIVLLTSLAIAAENNSGNIVVDDNAVSEAAKVQKARQCLNAEIEDRGCDDLSSEERIFSLLAVGKCRSEVGEDSRFEEEIKLTAQAILALNGDSDAEEWLLSQNTTTEDLMDWYLEIESPEQTTCEVSYGSTSYTIDIGTDKKIDSGAGSCLSLSEGGWWFKVSPSCYDESFKISCDQRFLTTLLFKKKSSSTIHVSSEISSASAEGTTTEKVNSFCFGDNACDYEASLWAALVLEYVGEDITPFKAYLTAMAEEFENEEYLPEAFLYYLTNSPDFLSGLLEKQRQDGYWDQSGDKFYDTAVALLPFQGENYPHKTDAKTWLLDIQEQDGCWQGNIRNTAFILYSLWGSSSPEGDSSEDDCEDANYFCMSRSSCETANGSELASYSSSCFGTTICCDKQKVLETCTEMNGKICSTGETCSISETKAYDSNYCCLGTCSVAGTVTVKSECEKFGGLCKNSCLSSEKENTDDCDSSGEVCCEEKTSEGGYTWVWILVILIVLVIVGFVFKDKLRAFWFRITSGRSRPGPGARGPPGLFPPPTRGPPFGRPTMPRRILPPGRRMPMRRPPMRRPQGELDDVLKKLKEMGG